MTNCSLETEQQPQNSSDVKRQWVPSFAKNGLFCIRQKSLMQCAPYAQTEVQHMPGIAEDSTGTFLQ